ncbi:LacI family DNA-binding transcriptional regulator [Phycisphaerales bacterium AB-hyl4]|uniref:LacI family DNA-binding transcriptional regulator n=1 Tax=Natronomicrosphaera hydrolytica TaxID=3242702 RepID=A0ABV4U6K9_9BACT
MAVTVTEIARKAGVSKGLVSRVLRDDQSLRITESRRQQVLAVAKGLGGIKRNSSGRVIGKRLARNIVVPINKTSVMQELLAHWENQGFKTLKSVLGEHGFRLSIDLYESDSPAALQEEYQILKGTCDGLVLLGGIVTKQVANFVLENKIPHVSIDSVGRVLGVNTVLEDAVAGYYQAVSHLSELGHTRIGFLGRTEQGHYPSFAAAMAHHGLDINPAWRCRSPRTSQPIPDKETGWRDAAREAFGQWLDDHGPQVTAICCHNDYGALGACDAMVERNLVPGKDLSIVGFGDFERPGAPQTQDFELTTIHTSLADLGRSTADSLISQILYKKTQVVHQLIPTELMIRHTTGACLRPDANG